MRNRLLTSAGAVVLLASLATSAYARELSRSNAALTASVDGGAALSPSLKAGIAASVPPVSASVEEQTQPNTSTDTKAEAQEAASSAVDGDMQVKYITFATTSVSMAYPVKARLFGIFPATLVAEAKVASDGTVNVSYPWYSFLFSTDQAEIQIKLKAVGRAASAFNTDALSAGQQITLLTLMHAALQSSLGASTTASSSLQ